MGASNPVKLVFPFSPKLIIIRPAVSSAGQYEQTIGIFVYGDNYPTYAYDGGGGSASIQVHNSTNVLTGWGTNTIQWYTNQYANRMFNSSGTTYVYVAFG